MKKFLALAVLATSFSSIAASRDIYDIMYLPKAGTNFGITQLNTLDRTIEFDSAETDISGFAVSQLVGRSFSDRFAASASLNYADFETDPEGFDKTSQSGISDPTFQARFRVLEDDFIFDIIGGALISLGDSEQESNGDTDNWQGGHTAFIGAQFGKKLESLQWAVSAEFTHNFERTVDIEDVGDSETDAYSEFLVQGDILNKLAEKSFLRSFASVGVEEQSSSLGSNLSYKIGTEYQHLFTQDLLARVGVDYGIIDHDNSDVDSDRTLGFHVGATYQF